MFIKNVEKNLTNIVKKEVKLILEQDNPQFKTFNALIDNEIAFDVIYVEGEKLTTSFIGKEELIAFTEMFYPNYLSQLKETYSRLCDILKQLDPNFVFKEKNSLEDFITNFYYDRPYYFYAFFEKTSEDDNMGLDINISPDFTIDESSLDFVVYFTPTLSGDTYTIQSVDIEKELYGKLIELIGDHRI